MCHRTTTRDNVWNPSSGGVPFRQNECFVQCPVFDSKRGEMMGQSPIQIYQKNREKALEFITNEILAEHYSKQFDGKYLYSLIVVQKKMEATIAEEQGEEL